METFWTVCDFCGLDVGFSVERDEWGAYVGLSAALDGEGSDYLAVWCAVCGPQHRSEPGSSFTGYRGQSYDAFLANTGRN